VVGQEIPCQGCGPRNPAGADHARGRQRLGSGGDGGCPRGCAATAANRNLAQQLTQASNAGGETLQKLFRHPNVMYPALAAAKGLIGRSTFGTG